jgi:membrane protein involved in colicin uptake
MDEEQFIAAMERENPTIEEIEDIAFQKKKASEEENKSAEAKKKKEEEEERKRREELAKKLANGEPITEDVLRDIFEGRATDTSEPPKDDKNEKQ